MSTDDASKLMSITECARNAAHAFLESRRIDCKYQGYALPVKIDDGWLMKAYEYDRMLFGEDWDRGFELYRRVASLAYDQAMRNAP